jgi:carbamoyltransferase
LGGFPEASVAFCLQRAGISLRDVAHVAVNQNSRANLWSRLRYMASTRPKPSLVMHKLRNRRQRQRIDETLRERIGPFAGRFHRVPHHEAHLASAFYFSGFSDSIVLSLDGFGDFLSTSWGRATADGIQVDGRVAFPHSLGVLYQAVTQFLGFSEYGDEYKVMGLAAYGTPRYVAELERVCQPTEDGAFELDLAFFRHHQSRVDYEWEGGRAVIGTLFADAFSDLLGASRDPEEEVTQRHRDIASSVQQLYEDRVIVLIRQLRSRYGLDRLCIAGGCGMNSVANGHIRAATGVDTLYVPWAPGDAGGAIGAASVVAAGLGTKSFKGGPFSGPAWTDDEIGVILEANAEELAQAGARVTRHDEAALCERAAASIAEGSVVGWFQGAMEFGPRALGSRSIIADARRSDMREILNVRIKRRELFRPFAPAVLAERAAEWFVDVGAVPYMSEVLGVRVEQRERVPAITHVDGTGRLQTVESAANPRFYRLIECFAEKTGVPMVINTSFNESEPIVCSPQDALACFLRTRMDVLCLQGWMIERPSA